MLIKIIIIIITSIIILMQLLNNIIHTTNTKINNIIKNLPGYSYTDYHIHVITYTSHTCDIMQSMNDLVIALPKQY